MGTGSFLSQRTPKNASHSTLCLESSLRAVFFTVSRIPFLIPIHCEGTVLAPEPAQLGRRHAWLWGRCGETLKSVLAICSEKGLKLNPCKCDLITTKVQFYGGIIDAKGVTFHPRHYEVRTSLEPPTTLGAPMELVRGANRIKTAITRFSEPIERLQSLIAAQYLLHNSREKSQVCNRRFYA